MSAGRATVLLRHAAERLERRSAVDVVLVAVRTIVRRQPRRTALSVAARKLSHAPRYAFAASCSWPLLISSAIVASVLA